MNDDLSKIMTPFNSLIIGISLASVTKVSNYVLHSDYA